LYANGERKTIIKGSKKMLKCRGSRNKKEIKLRIVPRISWNVHRRWVFTTFVWAFWSLDALLINHAYCFSLPFFYLAHASEWKRLQINHSIPLYHFATDSLLFILFWFHFIFLYVLFRNIIANCCWDFVLWFFFISFLRMNFSLRNSVVLWFIVWK